MPPPPLPGTRNDGQEEAGWDRPTAGRERWSPLAAYLAAKGPKGRLAREVAAAEEGRRCSPAMATPVAALLNCKTEVPVLKKEQRSEPTTKKNKKVRKSVSGNFYYSLSTMPAL